MNTVHAYINIYIYIIYSKTYSNLDPTALQPFAGKAKKIIQEFQHKFSEPCMIDPALFSDLSRLLQQKRDEVFAVVQGVCAN